MAQKVREDVVNIDGVVSEFEMKLERLKILYEQYFMGIEKREPRTAHHEVVRLMVELDKIKMHNHRLRYRYRTLVQRFNTYRTYWNRTLRAIELGTYHRDLARLRRKWEREGLNVAMPVTGRMHSVEEVERAISQAVQAAETGSAPAAPTAGKKRQKVPDTIRGKAAEAIKEEMDGAIPTSPSEERPKPPPVERQPVLEYRPPASQPRTGVLKVPPGMSEERMQSIFRRYLKAKRMVGDDPGTVRWDSLVSTISRQLPRLRELNRGKDVDFDVVIREGKVVLKAKPV